MRGKVPNQGDIIIANFSPQSGHEQQGKRPAVVISKAKFNRVTGLVVVCPITNTNRNFPLHVEIAEPTLKTRGFIMCEQIKSIDYKSRGGTIAETLPKELTERVIEIVSAIIDPL